MSDMIPNTSSPLYNLVFLLPEGYSLPKEYSDILQSFSFPVEYLEVSNISSDKQFELIESIRLVSRKTGIRVKSKGGGPLPISRKGLIGAIPTVLIYDQMEELVSVFPHGKGPRGYRMEIIEALINLQRTGSPFGEDESSRSIEEKDIAHLLRCVPSLLEEGLSFEGAEVECAGGRIDLVFKDVNDVFLLAEIEIEAKDAAIGQVTRFVLPFQRENNVSHVRSCIICIDCSDNILEGCRMAGIEVYQLGFLRRDI